jgi:hypothetical protein
MKKAQAINLSTSMLTDPTMEPLHVILPLYNGITHVPSELDGPALMVFIELQKCFQKSKKVCEGLLPNIIWGFEQCGYDPKHIAAGLTKLRTLKYIFYSDAGRSPYSEVIMSPDKNIQIWIRYAPKMMNLFITGDNQGLIFKGE